jgi:general secretion pathway protein C
MAARWAAFGIWAVVAASALFWGLRLSARGPLVPPHAADAGDAGAVAGDLSRVLGATPPTAAPVAAPPPQAARYRLIGVVAPRAASATGVALIAVDGQAAKAFRVGAPVDGDTVLKAVRQRAAELGPRSGAASLVLELPALPAAATGVPVAAAANGIAPAAAVVRPPQPLVRPVVPQVRPSRGVMPLFGPPAVPGAQPAPATPPQQVPPDAVPDAENQGIPPTSR